MTVPEGFVRFWLFGKDVLWMSREKFYQWKAFYGLERFPLYRVTERRTAGIMISRISADSVWDPAPTKMLGLILAKEGLYYGPQNFAMIPRAEFFTDLSFGKRSTIGRYLGDDDRKRRKEYFACGRKR